MKASHQPLALGPKPEEDIRVLGVDYGKRRIGIAIGDDETRIAMPLEQIAGRGSASRDAEAVAAFARGEEVGRVVVGLPLNMDGSAGPQAKATRAFMAALQKCCDIPVAEQDERLSSFAADELTRAAGLTRGQSREKRDKLAAQIILQTYFDGLSEPRA